MAVGIRIGDLPNDTEAAHAAIERVQDQHGDVVILVKRRPQGQKVDIPAAEQMKHIQLSVATQVVNDSDEYDDHCTQVVDI